MKDVEDKIRDVNSRLSDIDRKLRALDKCKNCHCFTDFECTRVLGLERVCKGNGFHYFTPILPTSI